MVYLIIFLVCLAGYLLTVKIIGPSKGDYDLVTPMTYFLALAGWVIIDLAGSLIYSLVT